MNSRSVRKTLTFEVSAAAIAVISDPINANAALIKTINQWVTRYELIGWIWSYRRRIRGNALSNRLYWMLDAGKNCGTGLIGLPMPSYCMNPPVSCQNLNPIASWLGPPPALMITPVIIRPMMVTTYIGQYLRNFETARSQSYFNWTEPEFHFTKDSRARIVDSKLSSSVSFAIQLFGRVKKNPYHSYKHQSNPHGIITDASGTCGICLSCRSPKCNQNSRRGNFSR